MQKLVRAHHVVASFLLVLSSSCLMLSGDFAEGECSPRSTESCYDGPSATMNVGECSSGTRTCSDDGRWSACEGQVLPKPEDCSKTGDEDCDGSGCSDLVTAEAFLQSEALFQMEDQSPSCTSIAWGPNGQLVLAGSFQGTFDFGTGALVSSGGASGMDGFLTRLDASGKTLASFRYGGGPGGAASPSIAVAPNGDVFVADTRTMGATSAPQLEMGRFDPTGKSVWAETLGGAQDGEADGQGIAIDSSSDVFVSGSFHGDIAFSAGASLHTAGTAGFVAKLNGTKGKAVWSKAIAGSGNTMVTAKAAVDSSGDVIVGGTYDGALSLPQIGSSSNGVHEPYVVKFDTLGNLAWSFGIQPFSRTGEVVGGAADVLAIGVDTDGNTIVAGSFEGSLSTLEAPKHVLSFFVAKIDAVGELLWIRGATQKDDAQATALAIEPDGSIVVAGSASSSIDFGLGALVTTPGYGELFLVRLDKNGKTIWAKAWSSNQEPARGASVTGLSSGSLAIDGATKRIALCGGIIGAIDFGNGQPIGEVNHFGVFVAEFEP